ncbi:IS110 family transposase [Pseudonocardia asaccharolytica]|uniref:IS110 family transposase n=1 Tax=Pseudonocardia asaccharolytica DSM 44247 = NBRC 16224 TaxID=1123024 RepID=A0A511CXH1_9PSEU|nr:IS110 family transposase [Pseudonocardia asaccharolytica]GEL17260.1 IS110 family transposase [Pseudonocardia asaccharolytica DSM 44247 = NBRC 16224]
MAVGIDVAKEVHWIVVVDATDGTELLSHRLRNDPLEINATLAEINALAAAHGRATVGLDIVGGIAGLLTATAAAAGLTLVHVPGLVVNRARRATVGGENKSDPRDARVIADQVRHRPELRPITITDEQIAQLQVLVSRRTDLVTEQTRRVQRLREHLVAIFPALERTTDPTNHSDLILLARYVTPAEIRDTGAGRMRAYLRDAGVKTSRADTLTKRVLAAAADQTIEVTGQSIVAEIVRELAEEALRVRRRLREIDTRIGAVLDTHPDAELITSLPGMGPTLTAELLATTGGLARFDTGDELAAAAGLAPVLHQSGRVQFRRRATTGKRALKHVFYRSAFCALSSPDAASKAYYARKRAEGKSHHQAVIALARRRVNVLHAILRTRQPYRPMITAAA